MQDELIKKLEQSHKLFDRMEPALREKIPERQWPSLNQHMDNLREFVDTAISINQQVVQDQKLSPNEATQIAELGLQLVEQLSNWMHKSGIEQLRFELDQFALLIAEWVIRHKGQIHRLESIVNAFIHLANSFKRKTDFVRLLEMMNAVVRAVTPQIRHDFDSVSLYRPWRLLNINRSIVAIRSQDELLMRQVFDDLVLFLPLDAPGFFEEGMDEIDNADYPPRVREVMLEYQRKHPQQQLH